MQTLRDCNGETVVSATAAFVNDLQSRSPNSGQIVNTHSLSSQADRKSFVRGDRDVQSNRFAMVGHVWLEGAAKGAREGEVSTRAFAMAIVA
jgi:hypothetical protein